MGRRNCPSASLSPHGAGLCLRASPAALEAGQLRPCSSLRRAILIASSPLHSCSGGFSYGYKQVKLYTALFFRGGGVDCPCFIDFKHDIMPDSCLNNKGTCHEDVGNRRTLWRRTFSLSVLRRAGWLPAEARRTALPHLPLANAPRKGSVRLLTIRARIMKEQRRQRRQLLFAHPPIGQVDRGTQHVIE